ncbi:hypothetical protein LDENG_00015760 [Lucifuga dentata]|nr:hypothetical protein LDENG_00015760 [Lucifuga dentata]
MASQACLESSLRRSASLGLEVLERASRRRVDWTNVSQTSLATDQHTQKLKRIRTNLDDAFDTIAEFMAQTTYQCKKFYESDSCTEPSNNERSHVCRFHSRPETSRSAPPSSKRVKASYNKSGEDFYIEVSPGTYAVTASVPESPQQTRLVNINAGESVNLTFNL